MRTELKIEHDRAWFVLRDVAPAYQQAVRDLVFLEEGPGRFKRSFPAATPGLDAIFARFTQYMPAILRQSAGEEAPPWEKALDTLLARVEGKGVDWMLGGSAALAARGIPVTPRDLDLITDDGGAHYLAELLADRLVQPLESSRGWIADWFCRAFVGMRLEWVGGLTPESPDAPPLDFGPTAFAQAETIAWRGHALKVPPLHLQLNTSLLRGLDRRAALIQDWMAHQSTRPLGGAAE